MVKHLILPVFVLATIALSSAITCGTGYSQSAQWCYKLMDAVDSFEIAEKNCRTEGGNLASIHDRAENIFVSAFGVEVLIGLHYSSQATDSYFWSDNTTFNFRNWEPNYPEDPAYFGDCVKMQGSGKWINVECTSNNQYICKKDPTSTPAISCPVSPSNEYHDSGELTSPGYPANYPASLSCTYVLLARIGLSVTVEINKIKLGAGDQIEIFAGLVPNDANRLAVLQGNLTGIPMIYSTPQDQNKALIRFTSKSKTGGQWKFEWHSRGLDHCPDNSHYTGDGQISSIGYPHAYGKNLDCLYYLSVSTGAIAIQFSKVDIEPGSDYIAIYDGPTPEGVPAKILTRDFYGGHTFRSTSNKVVVRFVSKSRSDPRLTGWSATFNVTCPEPWYKADQTGFGYCYLKLGDDDQGTFKEAKVACAEMGAKLVKIENEFQNELVEVLRPFGYPWLDLVYKNGFWQWSDGSYVQYANWAEGEPDIKKGTCAYSLSGDWRATSCERTNYVLCYKP